VGPLSRRSYNVRLLYEVQVNGEEMTDKAEEDMKTMRITTWHRVARDWKERKRVSLEAKSHQCTCEAIYIVNCLTTLSLVSI